MKHVDTLIVGFGLAGLTYAETLRQHQRSFHIIDKANGGSSVIAAGIYNPTVLKRFNMTWKGEEFHTAALPFYKAIEKRLSTQFVYPYTILKLFTQTSDHNQWSVASDRVAMSNFLDPKINKDALVGIKSPLGYAAVRQCGRIDTTALIQAYSASISDQITQASFDHSQIKISSSQITYRDITAKRIVFCEGYAMINNPFFNQLPLVGSKGQILIIDAPELKLDSILKGPIFIAPLGGNKFWAGASFEQKDKSLSITAEGTQWLKDKIDQMIDVPYAIDKQITHIRPTVKDRRPLLGTHKQYTSVHLFNGMGSRGVLTAPTAANWLFNHIEGQGILPKEANINRFEKIN